LVGRRVTEKRRGEVRPKCETEWERAPDTDDTVTATDDDERERESEMFV
jgi:hypothetical protein